jgi:DNA-binding LacI/PurR family transcriptional regulator
MTSVRGIAAKVGVSVATVSRALNNHPNVDPATRERVLQAVNRAGYAPSVGKRVSTVIGLVYPEEPVRADYGAFDASLLVGILRGVNELRYDVQIVSVQRDKRPDENFTQFFMRKGLRGVILRTFERFRGMCVQIGQESFPSVVVADRFDEPGVNFICCESREDSRRAVDHLFDLGHRRIALGMHNVPDTDHLDRKAGYEDAHRERGVQIDRRLEMEILATMQGGAGLVTRLMTLPEPPTAIFLTDPLATFGALRRCQELGIRVPQELSIIGFDDGDLRRHTFPAYTAVCQDAEMLGFESARWLTRVLSGQGEPCLRSIRSTMLEINQTTGSPLQRPIRILPDGMRITLPASDSVIVPGHTSGGPVGPGERRS